MTRISPRDALIVPSRLPSQDRFPPILFPYRVLFHLSERQRQKALGISLPVKDPSSWLFCYFFCSFSRDTSLFARPLIPRFLGKREDLPALCGRSTFNLFPPSFSRRSSERFLFEFPCAVSPCEVLKRLTTSPRKFCPPPGWSFLPIL